MQTKDFDFSLPDELIARYPVPNRSSSRLLGLKRDRKEIEHTQFSAIEQWVTPLDVLVLNNTKVMQARLFGSKETGGKLEFLVERVLSADTALVHIKSSKAPKCGTRVFILTTGSNGASSVRCSARVEHIENGLFTLRLDQSDWYDLMDKGGHMPLPPYMDRAEETDDRERYQTVYAKQLGAVAAPTAGLHFTPKLLNALRAKGVKIVEITLHVGAGTFQPVRVDNIKDHHMHSEWLSVSQSAVDSILEAKRMGGRVIGVGTTTVRSLETAALNGEQRNRSGLQAYEGESTLFIYPGFSFQIVDVMITNFHLPQSTLLMLVSAFAGQGRVMAAYNEAVRKQYRFFSYGDAMWLEKWDL